MTMQAVLGMIMRAAQGMHMQAAHAMIMHATQGPIMHVAHVMIMHAIRFYRVCPTSYAHAWDTRCDCVIV